MPPRLDRAELAKRFRNQGNDLVVQVASLMQGGILSAAAFSLIEILRTPGDDGCCWISYSAKSPLSLASR